MSSLPVIAHPKFQAELPSSGKKVTFRPFTGREQKIMLIAKESGAMPDVVGSLVEVIGACVTDLDVKQLPMFDLEYLFLRIRAKSVGDTIEIKIADPEDTDTRKRYDATVDLEDIKVVHPKDKPSDIVQINETVALRLKHPAAADVVKLGADADEWDMLASSVNAVIDGDNVIVAKDLNHGELKEWLKNMPLSSLDGVKTFFASRPTLSIKAKYKRDGAERTQTLSGLGDFFT